MDYNYQQNQSSLLQSLPTTMRTIVEYGQMCMEQRLQQILSFKNTSLIQ
jgi:hypothetical protein